MLFIYLIEGVAAGSIPHIIGTALLVLLIMHVLYCLYIVLTSVVYDWFMMISTSLVLLSSIIHKEPLEVEEDV